MILNPPPQPVGVPYGAAYVYLPWQVTPALIAKERLKAIIKQDRQTAPAYRWVLVSPAYWSFWGPLFKAIYRWERRQ